MVCFQYYLETYAFSLMQDCGSKAPVAAPLGKLHNGSSPESCTGPLRTAVLFFQSSLLVAKTKAGGRGSLSSPKILEPSRLPYSSMPSFRRVITRPPATALEILMRPWARPDRWTRGTAQGPSRTPKTPSPVWGPCWPLPRERRKP